MKPLIWSLMLTLSSLGPTSCTSAFTCNKSIGVFKWFNAVTVFLSVGPTASTDNQSEQASLRLFSILAVAAFTPVMGVDNTSTSSLNLCILTGRAQKVPRALFNHMLLRTFLPGGNSWKMWRKTVEKCFFCPWLYAVVAHVLISRAQMRRFWSVWSYRSSIISVVILLFSDHMT